MLTMLETNYKTFCSLNGTPVPQGPLVPSMRELSRLSSQTEMSKSRASKIAWMTFFSS